MKKVLLASTVLAMTATVAAAEVTLSGNARMGILNGFVTNPAVRDTTAFHTRIRVIFTMSGETDGGLAFGASVRADQAAGGNAGTLGSVFMSGAFGKISMGDVDGAAQMAVGHVDGVGMTGLGDTNESTFLAAGGLTADAGFFGITQAPFNAATAAAPQLTSDPTALYEYNAGAFNVYASVTNPGHSVELVAPAGPSAGDVEGMAYAIGANYTMDAYKVSIGYERLDLDVIGASQAAVKADHWIIGGDATFGQITLKARYGQADIDQTTAVGVTTRASKLKQTSLSATYKQDAISVTVFGQNKQTKTPAGLNIVKLQSVGLGGAYDLGGGASVVGGIAQLSTTNGAAAKVKDTAFDLGVSFTF